MGKPTGSTSAIVRDGNCTVKSSENVKVTIHIPKGLATITRQQKINRIYDILKPDTSR